MTDKAREWERINRKHLRAYQRLTRMEAQRDNLWYSLTAEERAWILAGGSDKESDDEKTCPGRVIEAHA